ncbi:hypothetical protein IE986_00845 [Klebsiella pneumoniae]|uniref:Uncharacterized protein n=1 Tax=Klebsiella pneumoniae TaxID=573 RepID=A0A927HIF0_KLEPN|nr:hypothetical protein [Klebsiella pneumoniae]
MFKQVHRPAALRLPGLRDNPSPGHPGPVQAQRRRTRTAASLLCRAAAAPARPTIRAACR